MKNSLENQIKGRRHPSSRHPSVTRVINPRLSSDRSDYQEISSSSDTVNRIFRCPRKFASFVQRNRKRGPHPFRLWSPVWNDCRRASSKIPSVASGNRPRRIFAWWAENPFRTHRHQPHRTPCLKKRKWFWPSPKAANYNRLLIRVTGRKLPGSPCSCPSPWPEQFGFSLSKSAGWSCEDVEWPKMSRWHCWTVAWIVQPSKSKELKWEIYIYNSLKNHWSWVTDRNFHGSAIHGTGHICDGQGTF